MNCVFCKQSSNNSKSVEHIVPESLGNTRYILPKGIVCDKCNQYFAVKIEQHLLEIPFFKSSRHRLNIVSKKGEIPPDKGFSISPKSEVEFHKSKKGEKSVSFKETNAVKKIQSRNKVEVLIPVFAKADHNNVYLSKFLGKLAIEALALSSLEKKLNLDDEVNIECLEPLKKYVRASHKNEFWPYYERILFTPEQGFLDSENEFQRIIFSMKFIYTEEKFLFHQFLLFGTEYTIDLTNRTNETIFNWLSNNNFRSPVLESAIMSANYEF
jgi:hypothetical protein